MTIKRKILFSIIALGLVVGAMGSLVVFSYVNNNLTTRLLESAHELTKEQEHEASAVFNNSSLFAHMLATRTRVKEYLVDKSEARRFELDGIFYEYDQNDSRIQAIYLLDKDGDALISTDKSFVGKNYSFRDYYKKALIGQASVHAYIGVTSEAFGYYFSEPVLDANNHLLGVLVIKTDGTDIIESIKESRLVVYGNLMLADENGVVVASTKNERFLKSLGPLQEETQKSLKEKNTYGGRDILGIQYPDVLKAIQLYGGPQTIELFDEEDDDREIFYVQKIGDKNFYLVSEIQLEQIEAAVITTTAIIVFLFLLFIVVLSVILYFVLSYLLAPIKKIKEVTERISQGDYSKRVEIETKDEFFDFAQSFNSMVANIENVYREISKKVEEQTAELNANNSALSEQRTAILNVLEDAEVAKKMAEEIAQKFSVMVANLPGITYRCLYDKNWSMVFISDYIRTLTGYLADDLIANQKIAYNDIIFSKDRKRVSTVINAAVKDKKEWSLDYRITSKEGNIIWVAEYGRALYDESGSVLFLDGIILDITQQKKLEQDLRAKNFDLEKFKLAVEFSSNHIVITDKEGIILYANKAAETITGFPLKKMLGQKVGNKNLWGGRMSKEFYENMWKTIKTEKKMFNGEIENIRANGEVYMAFASIAPVLDKNQNIIFFVGLERDITKEKEVDRAKTEFVSLASHQLRTPLSAINWYTEMLMDGDAGKLNKNQKQYLAEIYNGNQRMVSLVNSLLNVSRLELGTFMIEPVPTDLFALCDGVIKEMQPRVEAQKLQIKKKYDKNIKELMLDPNLIRIVLQNLISNAVKYTGEKGLIDISIGKEKEMIVISVKDTGLGIPENQKDKIFTRLFRADNVRKTAIEGTGLGLYIIKSIMENIGGSISFESQENKGTTFIVKFPAKGMSKKTGTKKLDS